MTVISRLLLKKETPIADVIGMITKFYRAGCKACSFFLSRKEFTMNIRTISKRVIYMLSAAIIMWVICSFAEISGHNHAALYGINKPYSPYNIVVLFDDMLKR